jgi:hypothetical protein
MPRYYVQLEPDGGQDEEGEELPGLDAAQLLVRQVAADLMKNCEPDLDYQSLVVKDDTGTVGY